MTPRASHPLSPLVRALLTVASASLLLAACEASADPASSADASATALEATPRDGGPDPSILPAADGVDVEMRVAEGVVPPTNRWYSALAFGETGLPVFPSPLSFAAVDGGFTMGLTRPTATATLIEAPAAPEITVTVEGASGFGEVTAATPVAVELTTGPLAVTLAQGVPAVAMTATAPTTLALSTPFSLEGSIAIATVGDTDYGLVAEGAVDGTTLTLEAGDTAQLFAVPDGGDAATMGAALGAAPTTADATFSLSDDAATTTVTYSDTPTVVAVPEARASDLACGLGSYATIHGTYQVCTASAATWDVPAVEPAATLDLSAIGAEERESIVAALREDAAATPELPADTYFGAKALYRLATLLTLADQLEETEVADALAQTLGEQLDQWAQADGCTERAERCFTYDGTMRGVVGQVASFGSDEFNDHHFHYGYLLNAAAIAGARDPELAERIAPVMNLLAEDIAAPEGSGAFPVRRAFDPVEGHAWASGTSPFGAGNNQESSSEAALAWNGVALWADVTGDRELGDSARWMLAVESEAARRLYLEPDLTAFEEYAHTVVAIEWGAKRDYATWFSAEPAAMLGIQLIPGAAAAPAYLTEVDAAQILASVEEAWGDEPAQFADYLLMYRALAGAEHRAQAWEDALALDAAAIDGASSRAWMLAWIATAG